MSLLVYGVLKPAAGQSIDRAIADGRPLPAPRYRLQLLQTGLPGKRLGRLVAAATNGSHLDNGRLGGAPYIVNFWSSWCPPCKEEAAALERMWRLERPRGVLFLGVDVQDVTDDARDFVREHRIDFPIVRDPGGDQLARYGIKALPETFVVDARGRIVRHIIGAATVAGLREALRSARHAP